jgi:hypothetical protein
VAGVLLDVAGGRRPSRKRCLLVAIVGVIDRSPRPNDGMVCYFFPEMEHGSFYFFVRSSTFEEVGRVAVSGGVLFRRRCRTCQHTKALFPSRCLSQTPTAPIPAMPAQPVSAIGPSMHAIQASKGPTPKAPTSKVNHALLKYAIPHTAYPIAIRKLHISSTRMADTSFPSPPIKYQHKHNQ